MSLMKDFARGLRDNLQNNTLTSCSRWATRKRIMGPPFEGLFSFKWHPWAKELHDSKAYMNVALKAAQTGFTEVAINRAFYTLDIQKRSVLYCLPTMLNASDFSKSRFNNALQHSDYIKSIFSDTNAVALKITHSGASLYIRGTRGSSNLKSIPVADLILDEVDEMSQQAVYMALERLSGQPDFVKKSIFALSTPSLPNWGVHKMYLSTTQEHFYFRCPSCSKQIELTWPNSFELVGEHLNDPRVHESYVKCSECDAEIDHATKHEILADGEWHKTNLNGDPGNRGFYINQLYSSTVSPGELAQGFLRSYGDEAAAQEFFNSKLGQPYLGASAQVTDDKLTKCISSHSLEDARPVDASRLITMGVDQGLWSYMEITEWFFDELTNDLNSSATPKVLWQGRFHEEAEGGWTVLDDLMREWQVNACVIDADPNTLEARRFARRFPGYVTLCRYRSGVKGRELSVVDDDTFAPIVTVDRTNWMDASLGRFHKTKIILPRDIGKEYLEHIKSPARKYERDNMGNPIAAYISTGPDHYSHARTYSEIALPFAASFVSHQDISSFL